MIRMIIDESWCYNASPEILGQTMSHTIEREYAALQEQNSLHSCSRILQCLIGCHESCLTLKGKKKVYIKTSIHNSLNIY